MKTVLFITWGCFGQQDMFQAFYKLGFKIATFPLKDRGYPKDKEKYLSDLKKSIKESKADFVFSFNFFPIIAQACKDENCKYLSWIYDSPHSNMLYAEALYETNYIFTFDSYMCNFLKHQGSKTIYYAPLAVNAKRLRSIPVSQEDREKYSTEISFIGALYNEEHHFFERLCSKSDPYTIGYLQALIMAQTDIYGCDLMEKCLTKDIIAIIEQTMPYNTPEGFLAPASHIYSNYYLARKVASTERILMLELLSESFETHLYTLDEEVKVGKATNRGIADYAAVMPKVVRCSKINMNPTLKSIHTGIPLRAMDIMGCGGFLLTNFQEDFFLHFEPDIDFVYYTSFEEMLDKAAYYLTHDEKRNQIRYSALDKVTEAHSFEIRLGQMLQIIEC
ncbi:MAG: glycosyltransferase [Lachnospiraceae bacterium]|nr:glycosyltransferase [Lachnospiraceae bacterium]